MSTSTLHQMPDGRKVQTILINKIDELTSHLVDFWSSARRNPMVAFDTEWDCNVHYKTSPNGNRAKIALLKLCNLDNKCLIINLCHLPEIPDILIRFLAVKNIKFVGVNISKDLEKLKEDHGMEIRNAIDLSIIAAYHWHILAHSHFKGYDYDEWDKFTLKVPTLFSSEKLSTCELGLPLLSSVVAGIKISSPPPYFLVTEDLKTSPGHDYLTVPVYVALRIGMKLFKLN